MTRRRLAIAALAASAIALVTACGGEPTVETNGPTAVSATGSTPELVAFDALGQAGANSTRSAADAAAVSAVLRFCDGPDTFGSIADRFDEPVDEICVAVTADNGSIYVGVRSEDGGWVATEVVRG